MIGRPIVATLVFVLAVALTPTGSWGQQRTETQDQSGRATGRAEQPAPDDVAVPQVQQVPERLLIARSEQAYPVTPGDVYRLNYVRPEGEVQTELVVQSNYVVDMRVFGTVNAQDMDFAELQEEIERVVATSFPRSSPSLTIESVGSFEVWIRGAIPQTGSETAWGMTRLSELLDGQLAPYSSIRDVEVMSRGGEVREYDLLAAISTGDLTQDPLLRPGDTVTVSRRDRQVELTGEVFRPGTYDLVNNETLGDLIRRFGQGLTPLSDSLNISIVRTSTDPIEQFVVRLEDAAASFRLADGDVVRVPSKRARLPIVYVEGAVVPQPPDVPEGQEAASLPDPDGYNKITVPHTVGITLYSVLDSVRENISSFAELSEAHIVRYTTRETEYVDMESLLYNYAPEKDVPINPLDRVIIPGRRPYVTVYGAVNSPGQVSFNPGVQYGYYVSAAGGIDPERSRNGAVRVVDVDGNRKAAQAIIEPGDSIEVRSNSLVYGFNRYFPLIASSLSLVTVAASLSLLLNN